jgi:preprotein translocase subunit SecD
VARARLRVMDEPPKTRSGAGACIALTLLSAAIIVIVPLVASDSARYAARVASATLDATLHVDLDVAEPAIVDETRARVAARLRRAGLLARVEVRGPRLVIACQARDVAEVERAVTRVGDMRYALLVGDELSAVDREVEIRRVEALKRWGPLPDDAPYDVIDLQGLEVLVEPAGGGPGAVEEAYRTLDAYGRPALGIELTVAAGNRFRALTRRAVGRCLALIVNGVARSAPVIRAEIGRRMVIEGGDEGWGEAELDEIILLLSEPLPARVTAVTRAR